MTNAKQIQPSASTPNDSLLTERPTWLTAPVWPHTRLTIDVNGTAVAYTDVGTGPTLLFAHVGTWSIVWRDVIEPLRDHYRCVALDAPGCGLSERPAGPLTVVAAAEAIDTLVRSLDLVDITLVVHDLGTVATLHAASRWPERIAGLVVINGFGWKPSGVAFRAMLALMGNPVMREVDAFTGWMSYASVTRFGVARHWDRATRRAYRRGFRRPQRRTFHRYLAAARRHDYRAVDETMRRLADRPVLTIFGKRNDPLHFQPKWKTRFPQATQITVPGGYHFPMCDDPQLVTGAVAQWHTDHILLPANATMDDDRRR